MKECKICGDEYENEIVPKRSMLMGSCPACVSEAKACIVCDRLMPEVRECRDFPGMCDDCEKQNFRGELDEE